MKQCTNCSFRTEDDSDIFCASCGAKLKPVPGNRDHCKACGAELKPKAVFCTKCGSQVSSFGLSLSTTPELGFHDTVCVTVEKSFATAPTHLSKTHTIPLPPVPTNGKYFSDYDEKKDYPFSGPITRNMIRELGRQAKETIPERVAYYAPLVGVKYKRILIGNQKTIWGSCDTETAALSFNCLLMVMPIEVLDSVIVHELCHLLQGEHSPGFYAEVYRVFPEYRKWDEWLEGHYNVLDRMEDGVKYHFSMDCTA